MRLVKQRKTIQIGNVEPSAETTTKHRHSALLPDSIRCLIVGPSNCGKTNVIICLLLEPNGLRFQNIYLYSKTPHQSKYVNLGRILDEVEGLGYFVYSDGTDIVEPNRARPNSIMIFDDIACDKQDVMREYFSMGRHSSVECFYLCQTYTRIPKQLIRDNANLLVLFRMDDLNLRHVYDDHVNTDMSFNQFKSMCSLCWKDRYGFLVIDKDSNIDSGRYRKGFDTFIER